MRKPILILTAIALLAGCNNGPKKPTNEELTSVLAPVFDVEGCATSTLFYTFPVLAGDVTRNKDVLLSLANIGMIIKRKDIFELSDLGKRSYNANKRGFCYTDSYEISSIDKITSEPEEEMSPALAEAWNVTLTVKPTNVDDWVKNPDLLAAASIKNVEEVTEGQQHTIRVVKIKGDTDYKIQDPLFHFKPGLQFNRAW